MSGRPRKACNTCKLQKIRCTGERPTCKRCLRLKHSCHYHTVDGRDRRSLQASRQPAAARDSSPVHSGGSFQGSYLGVPRRLIPELIELFYQNVCNSLLLLHKTRSLERVHAGTAAPHVLLSVCAWGANFYRDHHGSPSLKTGGFMVEWAQQAGRLAFQEIETFSEDLVVTFLNLTLFWHSQGSWKVSSLYKANAFHLLCIDGIGDATRQQRQTFEVEVRRRRFWAWYIMHCQTTESPGILESVGDLRDLPLPWCDEDFHVGELVSPTTTLTSVEGSTSIFAEMIKVMTFWSQAVILIRTFEASLSSDRLTAIYALDEKLSIWWRGLPASLKVKAESLTTVARSDLPRVLLINLVYHQSLCVLHASIVPLFCWTAGDDNGLTIRQSSAQIAYEHACTVSSLIGAGLAYDADLGVMPTFVAYAAYGCCAILIPFMWCSNLAIQYQARGNVRTNIRMINAMANHWKFATLLTVHVKCLYNIHKRDPPVLENEPKYTDIRGLIEFKTEALHARVSILEFLGILRKGQSSFVESGEEIRDLGIMQSANGPDVPVNGNNTYETCEASQPNLHPIGDTAFGQDSLLDLMRSQQWNLLPPDGLGVGMISPYFASDNSAPTVGGSTIDLMQLDLDHGLLDIEGWDYEPYVLR